MINRTDMLQTVLMINDVKAVNLANTVNNSKVWTLVSFIVNIGYVWFAAIFRTRPVTLPI